MPKRLFVTPILNTMGPVTDPRHHDLLNSWEAVDVATAKYFSDSFRKSLIDSKGNGVVVSWFPVSWSGFDSNPVQRDFGWFTIYDHMVQRWGKELAAHNDGLYWMYNHPDKSGVGNAWGLDWLHNCHYLNILNRMILERSYFPGVIEIPTADTHSVNFVENFFPFELSNRFSPHINWDNIEADGRKTREVLQWADAPGNWVPYRPDSSNHQKPGEMKHLIFRLLDIKTRIMSFPEDEIISAFESCRQGHDVIIAGYEHDFRDRCDTVKELFLDPIGAISKRYPDVEVVNTSFQSAALECVTTSTRAKAPEFTLDIRKEYICISSDCPLFGPTPYVAMQCMKSGNMVHINPTPNGRLNWCIQRTLLPEHFIFGVAGFSAAGLQAVSRYEIEGNNCRLLSGDLSNIIPISC